MAGSKTNGADGIRIRELDLRYQLLRRALDLVALTLCVYVARYPLTVIRDTVEPFAGAETIVEANVALSITVGLSIAVHVVQAIRTRSQTNELERARQRIRHLEAEIITLQNKLDEG